MAGIGKKGKAKKSKIPPRDTLTEQQVCHALRTPSLRSVPGACLRVVVLLTCPRDLSVRRERK